MVARRWMQKEGSLKGLQGAKDEHVACSRRCGEQPLQGCY